MEHDSRHHLSGFDNPSHRRLNSRGRGYTLFVKATKLLLPVVALVIIGIVTFRLSGPQTQNLIPDKTETTKTEAGQIELEGARYEGVDTKGHPYTVSSDIASRAPENEKTIILTSPKAEIALSEKTKVALSAAKGNFDSENGKLDLNDDVVLSHNDGYELHMSQLKLDVNTHEAQSDTAVEGSGPAGTLKAAGLAIENKGELVIFRGPAVLTIIEKPAKKSPQEKDG